MFLPTKLSKACLHTFVLLGHEGPHDEKYFGQDCGEPGEGISSCTPYSVDLVQNHQGMAVITLDQGKFILYKSPDELCMWQYHNKLV